MDSVAWSDTGIAAGGRPMPYAMQGRLGVGLKLNLPAPLTQANGRFSRGGSHASLGQARTHVLLVLFDRGVRRSLRVFRTR
jgi:hypothetical protein